MTLLHPLPPASVTHFSDVDVSGAGPRDHLVNMAVQHAKAVSAHMLAMTTLRMDSTLKSGVQLLALPLSVSTAMQIDPPAVTCPVYHLVAAAVHDKFSRRSIYGCDPELLLVVSLCNWVCQDTLRRHAARIQTVLPLHRQASPCFRTPCGKTALATRRGAWCSLSSKLMYRWMLSSMDDP